MWNVLQAMHLATVIQNGSELPCLLGNEEVCRKRPLLSLEQWYNRHSLLLQQVLNLRREEIHPLLQGRVASLTTLDGGAFGCDEASKMPTCPNCWLAAAVSWTKNIPAFRCHAAVEVTAFCLFTIWMTAVTGGQ